jgi:hypothetical protein
MSDIFLWNVFWNFQYKHCKGFLRTAGDRNLEEIDVPYCMYEMFQERETS